jgi:hypothetical protein
MARFNPPSYSIPLGFVTINNQRFDVVPDKVFFDYLNNVFERIGGEAGLSADEIVALVEDTSAELLSTMPRKTAAPQAIEPMPQRSNTSEVQALRDRVQSLESQLRSARSEQATLARAIDELRAEVRRIPSLAALERRLSDIEAVTH